MGSEKILLISEAMVQQSFRGVDPIGKQIMCGWDSIGEWWTIVGVVGDVRQESPAASPAPTIYTPVAQHPQCGHAICRWWCGRVPMLERWRRR